MLSFGDSMITVNIPVKLGHSMQLWTIRLPRLFETENTNCYCWEKARSTVSSNFQVPEAIQLFFRPHSNEYKKKGKSFLGKRKKWSVWHIMNVSCCYNGPSLSFSVYEPFSLLARIEDSQNESGSVSMVFTPGIHSVIWP